MSEAIAPHSGPRSARRRLFFSFLALAFSASPLLAYSDPRGDVFPNVKVENGNFAVYFYNRSAETNNEEDMLDRNVPVYRMVYSPAGELLGPRARCQNFRSDSLHEANSMVYDKKIELRDEQVLFEADFLKGGKPSFFIKRNGSREHRRLPWPDNVKIDYVAGVHVDERSLVISATVGEGILAIFHFDRMKFEAPGTAIVGQPAFINDFPRASNPVLAADRYWIGWVRYNQGKKKFETVLSDWKPGEEKMHETILDAPSDWNTDLSLAAIGTQLCLAYHCSIPNSATNESPAVGQIITIFREAQ
jgi:hypothetical protein